MLDADQIDAFRDMCVPDPAKVLPVVNPAKRAAQPKPAAAVTTPVRTA